MAVSTRAARYDSPQSRKRRKCTDEEARITDTAVRREQTVQQCKLWAWACALTALTLAVISGFSVLISIGAAPQPPPPPPPVRVFGLF